jgi:hypothetical protein
LPVTRNRSQPAIDTRRKPAGYKTEEIEGVGPAYAQKLAAKMAEVNAANKLTRTVATEKILIGRVKQAKSLDPPITH